MAARPEGWLGCVCPNGACCPENPCLHCTVYDEAAVPCSVPMALISHSGSVRKACPELSRGPRSLPHSFINHEPPHSLVSLSASQVSKLTPFPTISLPGTGAWHCIPSHTCYATLSTFQQRHSQSPPPPTKSKPMPAAALLPNKPVGPSAAPSAPHEPFPSRLTVRLSLALFLVCLVEGALAAQYPRSWMVPLTYGIMYPLVLVVLACVGFDRGCFSLVKSQNVRF